MLTTTAEGGAEMITLIIQNPYCQQGSTRIPVTMAADENVQALLVKPHPPLPIPQPPAEPPAAAPSAPPLPLTLPPPATAGKGR
jgi:hypothetical protein